VLKRKTFLDKIEIIKNIVKGKIRQKSDSPAADLDRSLSGFRRGLLVQAVRGASVSRARALSILLINPFKKPPDRAFLELPLYPYGGGQEILYRGLELLLDSTYYR
jgi:hypothetical protein